VDGDFAGRERTMLRKLFKRRRSQTAGKGIEPLETRRLLSDATVILPTVEASPDRFGRGGGGNAPSLYVPSQGYTPVQINDAYGVNDITFTDGITSSAAAVTDVSGAVTGALMASTVPVTQTFAAQGDGQPDVQTSAQYSAQLGSQVLIPTTPQVAGQITAVPAVENVPKPTTPAAASTTAPDTVAGDGAGTTIAIVDAFNDPNIQSDLGVFDTQNSLPAPPTFTQVSQNGGSTASLKVDSGWDLETSLDVEFAHAVAPAANILLVEANNDNLNSLLNAVNYARTAPNVAVVSMSWGGSEFASETSYDKYFTTPAGHRGVTFVASSGDSGSWYGPEWPASSPNVLSVGGTSLYAENSTGAYGEEVGWSGSGGGVSSYETEPAYQNSVQSTGGRTTPDVSYDADPNTGVAVYDSIPDSGVSGWQVIGGTSAAAPQWAGLVAIADQGRALSSSGSLDGQSGTLPILYSLANNATTYAADFHDITLGATSYFATAGPGYDLVTGLGTPQAQNLVAALVSANTQTGAFSGDVTKKHLSQPKTPTTPLKGIHHPVPPINAPPISLNFLRAALAPQLSAPPAMQQSPPVHTATFNDGAVQAVDSTKAITPSTAAMANKIVQLVPTLSQQADQAGFAAQDVSLLETRVFDTIHIHGPIEAALPARMILEVAKLDATMFADSIRAFARESAAVGTVSTNVWVRAISVSAGSLMGDLIVVGYWYHSRMRRKANGAVATQAIEA
jgi:hypothetical protein